MYAQTLKNGCIQYLRPISKALLLRYLTRSKQKFDLAFDQRYFLCISSVQKMVMLYVIMDELEDNFDADANDNFLFSISAEIRTSSAQLLE